MSDPGAVLLPSSQLHEGCLQGRVMAGDAVLMCARKLAVKPAYSTARPEIKNKKEIAENENR